MYTPDLEHYANTAYLFPVLAGTSYEYITTIDYGESDLAREAAAIFDTWFVVGGWMIDTPKGRRFAAADLMTHYEYRNGTSRKYQTRLHHMHERLQFAARDGLIRAARYYNPGSYGSVKLMYDSLRGGKYSGICLRDPNSNNPKSRLTIPLT